MNQKTSISGVTVVEVLIGLVILSLVMVFIFHTFTLFFNAQRLTVQSSQAIYLAEQGQEMVRYLRDDDWNTFEGLSKNTQLYLQVATATIAMTATPQVLDGTFTRSVYIRDAYRNASDDFVASTTPGASIDTDSRVIDVVVSWGTNRQVRLQSLLTNIRDI
jgi:type II secretory pathway pseudopilin PulG